MLRWRIRSALYIDFENVPLPPDAIANWLAWLEDGVFEPSRQRRRFLQKRVYWNSHAERNRELFQRHGFVPILVGKFSGLKNGADIRMAMDVVEATYTRSEIQEFILLTGDSDFVPVLERLRHKSKRSAIVATEHRPNIHTTYQLNADVLIPSRRLAEAAQYQRPSRGILNRLLMRRQPVPPLPRAAVAPAAEGSTAKTGPAARAAKPPPQQQPSAEAMPVIETAARRVAKLITQQPRNYVAQKRVLAELDKVQGFKRQGPAAFLGLGSYKALMKELARLDPRISVVEQPGGGTGVVFVPPSPTAENKVAQPAEARPTTGPTVEGGAVSTPALEPGLTERRTPGSPCVERDPESAATIPTAPSSRSVVRQAVAIDHAEPRPPSTHSERAVAET